MQEEILTIKEVAKILRVKPVTIYKLCNEGKLPAFKLASFWRIKRSILTQWIQSQSKQ